MSSSSIEWIRRVVTESLAGLAGARVFHAIAPEENKVSMGWIGAILCFSTAMSLNLTADDKIKKTSYEEGLSEKNSKDTTTLNYRTDHVERLKAESPNQSNSIQK